MKSFWSRLSDAQEDIGVLEKNADNPFFRSKYADITSMLKQIKPILKKHKMVITQPSRVIDGMTHQGTVINDEDSDAMIESWCIMPDIEDPQKKFAASTYFRRLTLQNLLAIGAEDDDGNTAAGKSKPNKGKQSKGSNSSNRDF